MYKIYQIEYGDTLDIISQKANTSVENIKKINGINDDSELIVGSLIVIPKLETQIFNTYKVLKGDTIYDISKKSNIDIDTLLLLNGLSRTDYIYPDQEIIIPREDINIYITREGDTLKDVLKALNADVTDIESENDKLYLVEDQLIIHKKDANN